MNNKLAVCLIAGAWIFFLYLPAVAQDTLPSVSAHALAPMAPAGRWAARLEVRASAYDHRYDNDGKRRDLDADFDGLDLNSQVFPNLALLGSNATLGETAIDTSVSVERLEFTLGYGVNADLTVGIIVPYAKTHTDVKFAVNGGNVGFNPGFNPAQPIGAGNFPFAPVGAGAAAPVGRQGVKQILHDPAFGYGYDTIDDTTTSDFDDPTLGALWRFHKGAVDSAILGFGVRFGVAKGDDPDNLLDVPTGDGSTDLRTRLEYFRDLSQGFDARFLIESKVQTSDHVRKRVPASGELLTSAASEERLGRDLGDIWEYDVELGHRWADWRVAATWHRYTKGEDDYTSDKASDVSSIEANTKVSADQWRASVSWSGINAWRSGGLAMPLIAKFEVQETYAGRNFVDVRDYYLILTSMF